MSPFVLAFFTGLFGSIHCVSMCGPLMMALPLSRQSVWHPLLQRVLYQLGRIMVYSFLGVIFGWVGAGFSLLGMQRGLSLVTGIVLIGFSILHLLKVRVPQADRYQRLLINPLAKGFGKYLVSPFGGLFAGMLNGFLPCGMVYLALAGAVNTGSMLDSVRYMFFFGLGTTPLMLAAAIAALFARRLALRFLTNVIPYVTLLTGIWLVLRGAELGLPFFTAVGVAGAPVCH